MKKANQGDWVKIHSVVLEPQARATQVPEDTKQVPLELWAKGWLEEKEAVIGDEVSIKTVTGRTLKGALCAIKPPFNHDFGEPVPELLTIGTELRSFLKEEGSR